MSTIMELQRSNIITPFEQRLRQENTDLRRESLEIVQVNLGKLCNQACLHCHVEAGPQRTEIMCRNTAEQVVEFIRAADAHVVDLTGGAPEMNPTFRWLVEEVSRGGRHVMVRSNLTVLSEPGLEDLPEFFAQKQVEIVASLPCYTQENVDQQRGQGAYLKSTWALERLNKLGYGQEGSPLILNLVYNPLGAYLPGPQASLEADYKRELFSRSGVTFNHLYTITNMNLGRFSRQLQQNEEMAGYSSLLAYAFNPATLSGLMCLRQVSISWDGYLYDCDFNQMLDMRLGDVHAFRLGKMPFKELARQLIGRRICTGNHCYACTAGTGSSCTGALA